AGGRERRELATTPVVIAKRAHVVIPQIAVNRLASIRTTHFLPVDLNAFLYKLETAIANIAQLKGIPATATVFRKK
ncbi:hypothetical protein C3O71_22495, partial [Cronobacter sakazakii]|uniref:trehalase family glycosidase n=1 Tax=Cronobacter sakazakii TaxID=28141 RepID=UPI000FEF653C